VVGGGKKEEAASSEQLVAAVGWVSPGRLLAASGSQPHRLATRIPSPAGLEPSLPEPPTSRSRVSHQSRHWACGYGCSALLALSCVTD
jgi:hypothetical protein